MEFFSTIFLWVPLLGGTGADGAQQGQKEDKKDRKQGGNSLHAITMYVQPGKARFDFRPSGNAIICI